MADLASEFLGIPLAEPLLARVGAADGQGLQRQPRLRGGLGRRRVEDARRGPAHRQRERPALRRDSQQRPARDRLQQHRAHHRPAAADQPRRDPADQARLAGPGAGGLGHVPDERGRLAEVRADDRGHRRGRHRAQLRLPARHVGARHGRRGRPGARVHTDGDRVGEGSREGARHRQADAERRPTSCRRPKRRRTAARTPCR